MKTTQAGQKLSKKPKTSLGFIYIEYSGKYIYIYNVYIYIMYIYIYTVYGNQDNKCELNHHGSSYLT